MGLYIHREEGETWREAAARYGRKHGLEHEVLVAFDAEKAANPGLDEAEIAFDACLSWDVCDVATG